MAAMGAVSVRSAALLAALMCAVLVAGAPARADVLGVSASGVKVVKASTSAGTGRIVATFAVTDPTMTATGATICRRWSGHAKDGCTYQRFDRQLLLDEYDEEVDYPTNPYERWDVTGAPGSWSIAYPIGFARISREQCLTAAWKDKRFAADISVQNDAGTQLAEGTWNYEVQCSGIEGGTTGPERTMLHAGSPTTSRYMRFSVVDTAHRLTSYRVCMYNWAYGTWYRCDYEDLKAHQRTQDGWQVGYRLEWNALGSSTCSYVGRKWPSAGFRLQFFSTGLRHQLTLARYTRLDC